MMRMVFYLNEELKELLVVLQDSNGVNWGVYVFHDNDAKFLYTTEVDRPGVQSLKIKTFAGLQKIKIGTNGQIVTYPMDDLG